MLAAVAVFALVTGTILGAASRGVPVVIDGFIASTAALLAVGLCPGVAAFLLAYEAAVAAAGCAIRTNPSFLVSHAVLAASYAKLKQLGAAAAAVGRLLELAPGFRTSSMEQHEFTVPHKVAEFGAALRAAGLPE